MKKITNLQSCSLNILNEIKPILDKYNIHYFIQGGTMLGAVRHKGFIPWDDDIDIGIIREDYDYLISCIQNLLPDYMKLRTYKDNSAHEYYFARIVDTRFKVERLGSLKIRYEESWIDLFPLDGMPNNFIVRKFHEFRLLIARLKYHLSNIDKVNIKRPDRTQIEKIIIYISVKLHIGENLNTRKELDAIDCLLRKYSLSNSEWIINFMGQTNFHFNELMKKNIYGKGRLYRFENLNLMGPKYFDEYLKKLYKDYMKLPPKNERNAHALKFINK